jgi:uncharacterized RDD family membrane protein YckC
MKPEEIYISQVLSKLPAGHLRTQIEMELRSHIADRIERGHTVDEAIRQLGDPTALAESYLSAVPLVPAPHLRRIAAKFVDVSIPIAFVVTVTATVVLGMPERMERGPMRDPIVFLAALSVVLVSVLYGLGLAIAESRTGQTLGKRLFGLRVVSETGTRIGLGRAFVRQLPVLFQFVWVDALFALFTDRRQRAFEMLTKTRVVDARDARHGAGVPAGLPLPVAL